MRLLIVSDIHGHSEKIQPISNIAKNTSPDAVIICGDVTNFGNLAKASTILKEFAKLAPTFFVPGNCDPPRLALEPFVEEATNLHGKCLSVLGTNFIGIGGSVPTPFRTPFELTEDEIGKILDTARKSCCDGKSTILIAHDPPYGTKADRVFAGYHVGSKAVRDFMEKTNPSLVACGHIHESRAVDSLRATMVVNPGPFHRGYYASAEIGEGVSVRLETLE